MLASVVVTLLAMAPSACGDAPVELDLGDVGIGDGGDLVDGGAPDAFAPGDGGARDDGGSPDGGADAGPLDGGPADGGGCATGFQDHDGDGECAPACGAGSCGRFGACDDQSGSVMCACEDGHTGSRCDECARGALDGVILVDGSPEAWEAPHSTLQDALRCIREGDASCEGTLEIWLAEGRQHPDEGVAGDTDDPALAFELPVGTALYGGFRGDECGRVERDPAAYVTVLSGDITQDDAVDAHGVTTTHADAVGINSEHVVTIEAAPSLGTTTVLDGLTISAGRTSAHGGGIDCQAADGEHCDLSLVSVALMGNAVVPDGPALTAHGILATGPSGGALYVERGRVRATDLRIHGSYAYAGGALVQLGGTFDGTGVAISSTDARYAVAAFRDTAVSLNASEVSDNQADWSSGLHIEGHLGTLVWEGGRCERNVGKTHGACVAFRPFDVFGPALPFLAPNDSNRTRWASRPHDLILREVHIADNEFTGSSGTAGVTVSKAKVLFDRVVAERNRDRGLATSGNRVGVLDMAYGDFTAVDSRFENNVGGWAGALRLSASDVRIHRSAFIGNTADGVRAVGAVDITYSWSTALPIVIAGCVFDGNTGKHSTLRVESLDGPALITSSTFRGNTSLTDDFGILTALYVPEVRVENGAFVGNALAVGPVAHLHGITTSIRGSTFAGNQSGDGGPSVRLRSQEYEPSVAHIEGSILWDADLSTSVFVTLDNHPTALTVTRSVIRGGDPSVVLETPGAGTVTYEATNRSTDPRFVDLAGADAVAGTEDDDLHLMSGSPAVDLADASQLPADVADLDGDGDTTEPTPLDVAGDPRVQGAGLDSGAFESM